MYPNSSFRRNQFTPAPLEKTNYHRDFQKLQNHYQLLLNRTNRRQQRLEENVCLESNVLLPKPVSAYDEAQWGSSVEQRRAWRIFFCHAAGPRAPGAIKGPQINCSQRRTTRNHCRQTGLVVNNEREYIRASTYPTVTGFMREAPAH